MTFGIIAGSGQFPLQLAQELLRAGSPVVVAAHLNETDRRVDDLGAETTWVELGQLGVILELFHRANVTTAFMAGAISRHNILQRVKLDALGMQLFNGLDLRGDDALLRAIARVFEDNGITIGDAALHLPQLKLPTGVIAGTPPTDEQWRDIALGVRAITLLDPLDVTQTVVVRAGSLWALEAADGTDATIRRGGTLAGPGSVVVKMAKPSQDHRFDAPSIGLLTIATMGEVASTLLAVDARRSLVFDRQRMLKLAQTQGISIWGLSAEEIARCA